MEQAVYHINLGSITVLFFDIKFCSLRACQNWRMGDKCVKDEMYIPTAVSFIANIHDASVCRVREQIDIFRLNEMLEK